MQTTADYRSTAKQLTVSIRKWLLYLQQKLDKLADQTVLTQISLKEQSDLGLHCFGFKSLHFTFLIKKSN